MVLARAGAFAAVTLVGVAAPAGEPGGSQDLDAGLALLGEPTSEADSGLALRLFRASLAEEARIYLLDRGQAAGGKNDEQLITEAELELELGVYEGLSLFARPWFLLDALDTELIRYEPLESYLAYTAPSFDVRAGQFIESWGIADTFNPVDVLNRRDLGTDALDPTVRGELGARVRWTLPGSDVIDEPTFGLYLIPLWRGTELPTDDQRFGLSSQAVTLREGLTREPRGVQRLFSAARFDHIVSTPLFAADLQYLVARGPARTPVFDLEPEPSGVVSVIARYYGELVAGGGFRAVPTAEWWSKLTLKAEIVYKRPYAASSHSGPVPGDFVQFAVGFDRAIPRFIGTRDELTLTVESVGELGADDQAAAFRPFDHDLAVRFFWEAGDFSRTSLETRAVVDLTNTEFIAELVAARKLRFVHDDLELQLSSRWIRPAPGETSFLARFPANNSDARLRLELDF